MDQEFGPNLTRRSFLLASAIGTSSLLLPFSRAYAVVGGENITQEEDSCTDWILDHPELSFDEFALMAQKNTEREVDRILEELRRSTAQEITPYGRDNDFSTTYGTRRLVTSPFTRVAGQDQGGAYFPKTGGSISVVPKGGGTINFTYSFPTPFGSIGVSGPLGKTVGKSSVLSENINIPGAGFYIATQQDDIYSTPYVIYRKVNGKKTIVKRGANCTQYRHRWGYKKVG